MKTSVYYYKYFDNCSEPNEFNQQTYYHSANYFKFDEQDKIINTGKKANFIYAISQKNNQQDVVLRYFTRYEEAENYLKSKPAGYFGTNVTVDEFVLIDTIEDN